MISTQVSLHACSTQVHIRPDEIHYANSGRLRVDLRLSTADTDDPDVTSSCQPDAVDRKAQQHPVQDLPFDPRNNKPFIGRILIARGRDAADVSISNSFGPFTLKSFKVWTDEVTGQ